MKFIYTNIWRVNENIVMPTLIPDYISRAGLHTDKSGAVLCSSSINDPSLVSPPMHKGSSKLEGTSKSRFKMRV
jgi:hypothetical protein